MPKVSARLFAVIFSLICSSAYGAGTPVISLDASGLTLGNLTTWTNTGSSGGSFTGTNNPQVQDLSGKRCVTFSGSNRMKATFAAPSTITGSNPFSVAAWVYNPSIGTEEAYLTWAQRGTTARCAQFNYGTSATSGAVTHTSADIPFLSGNAPSASTWHHIAVTYDGTTEKLYVDGNLNNSKAQTLNIFAGQPIYLATSYTDSAGNTRTLPFSGSIASLRVYAEALTQADIASIAGLRTITGSVTAGGVGLGGVTVCLKTTSNATVNPTMTTTTAADGSYIFAVQPGVYTVGVDKAGYSPRPTADYTANVTASNKTGVNFALTYVGAAIAKPFDLSRVRLLPGIFKDAEDRDLNYLLYLQPDRFLYNFRVTAGLSTGTAQPYGGWDAADSELRGHAAGHYLSALCLMYASTGNTEMKTRADYLVAELAKCQAALPGQGYNTGYLSAYPESFFDRLEAGTDVWVPYYTLHKIMAGLYDAYKLCGNQQALTVLTNMAGWVKFRCDRLNDTQMASVLNVEFGGMGETLASLYAVTNNPDHLALALRFEKKAFTDPIFAGTDGLPGWHANTHIPQMIASARLFEVSLQTRQETIASNFWNFCTSAHCYPTGGTSNYEGWGNPNTLSGELSNNSEETCCSYNMLKLSNHLLSWYANAKYGDYIERTLLNHILTVQYPGVGAPQYTGMNSYYTSLVGGHWKRFHTPDNDMWCCTGSGFEHHARYGESIYFADSSNLYVNLFIASTLNWSEKGVTITQNTSYPEAQTSSITVQTSSPVAFGMKVRVPAWATSGVQFRVNGQLVSVTPTPSTFVTISRTWSNGDVLTVTLPMTLRYERFADNNKLVGIFYGPTLLAGALGTENFDPMNQINGGAWGGFSDVQVPMLLAPSTDPNQWMAPVAGSPVTFKTQNAVVPKDITFIPFYRMFDQRYNVFWQLYTESPQLNISDLSGMVNQAVSFQAKGVSIAPRNASGSRSTNYFYIEDYNKTAGIRVEGSSIGYDNVSEGQLVALSGVVRTKPTGELYIQLTAVPTAAAGVSVPPLGMTTRPAARDKITLAKAVRIGGKLTSKATDGLSFTLDDGYKKSFTEKGVKVQLDSGIPVSYPEGCIVQVDGVVSATGATPQSATRVLLAKNIVKIYPRTIDLFAKYLFDSSSGTTAIDSVAAKNGTLVSASWAAGRSGNAVSLNGTSSYVTLPTGIVSTLGDFTISTWVKLNSVSGWSRIFDFGTGTAVNMFLTPSAGGGNLRFAITTSGGGGEQQINGNAPLAAGSWQQVVVTRSGSTGILYVNGVEVGRNTGMSLQPMNMGSTNLNYIGKSQYGDPYLSGLVDDFRIYSMALNATEVLQLYNGQL